MLFGTNSKYFVLTESLSLFIYTNSFPHLVISVCVCFPFRLPMRKALSLTKTKMDDESVVGRTLQTIMNKLNF